MIDPNDNIRIRDNQKVYSNIAKRAKPVQETPQPEESLFSTEKLTIEGAFNLTEILKESESIPEVRQELVAKFQKLIEENGYKPDAERIVKRLLEG